MNDAPLSHLRPELRALYQAPPLPVTEPRDPADHGFIGVSLIERSLALCGPELEGELLDVGSGSDPYRGCFPNVRRKVNCDYSGTRGPVDFLSSAVQLPVRAETFDSILCTEVLEHVPDPLATWREFHRVLRPGGRVLLSTPMYWPPHELPFDFYRYPEHGLRALVTRSGFEIEAMYPRGGVWALWGQVTLHVMPQYFRFRWQRWLWNRALLGLDRWRNNAQITLGWTVLARKKSNSG
jgi:SAM-dependent methyltransferase